MTSYNFANLFVFQNPATGGANKAPIEPEYYRCNGYNQFDSGSTLGAPNTIPTFDCTTCTFSQQTTLFDYNHNTAWCNSDTWSYDAQYVPKVARDFYSSSNILSNFCQKLTPAQATLAQTGTVCSNAVVAVKLVIMWNSGSVNRVLVRLILSNIDTATQTNIRQLFEVKWFYDNELLIAPRHHANSGHERL